MKYLFSIISFFAFAALFAQNEFPIQIADFSSEFKAVIALNEKDTIIINSFDEFKPEYVVKVTNKKTNSIALEAYLSDFPDYLFNEKNEAIPNIKELPYGRQSVLIYEDFNFDGIKDFAIMNGYGSCYGGPSFDIYLTDKNQKLTYSKSFSELSNNYCGMFQIDDEPKTIHTMTKSGCCWHQFSEFKVIENEPKPVKITEIGITASGFEEVTEINYKNGKEFKETKTYFPLEEYSSDIIFSFELEKSKKRVVVYQNYKTLNYALILDDNELEFYYPDLNADEENQEKFVYDNDKNTLTFTNDNAEYQIYETENSVGIKVKTNGKIYDLKGKKSTAIGTLEEIPNPIYTNLLVDNF